MSKEILFSEITDVSALPISDYHKLKKSLSLLLDYLAVDRCSLLYSCNTDVPIYMLPFEATSAAYPGANKLKIHLQTSPIFQHICETIDGTTEPVSFKFDDIEPKLLDIYESYSIKAQMVKLIELPNGEKWGLSVQQCSSTRIWSDEAKEVLNKVAEFIKPILISTLDISTLLDSAVSATDLIDDSPLPQVIYNMDRNIVYANEPYCQVNNYELSSLLGQHGQQFLANDEQYKFDQFFDQILEHGKGHVAGMRVTGKGSIIHVESHGLLINYNGNRHYLITLNDVSDKIIAQQQIQSYSDIQHAIMEATDDGILVEDSKRKIITINQVFFDTFSLPPSLLKEKNHKTLEILKAGMPKIHDAEEVAEVVYTLNPTSSVKTSTKLYLINGKVLDLVSFPLVHDDIIKGRVWYFKDVTENTLLTQKLSFEATHDPLTKLINRRGFDEELSQSIERLKEDSTVHALLYLDLDQFKIINDSCGHSAGDMALIEVSHLLLNKIRSADILARVGGDEFCILLKDCPPDVAHKLSEEIRQEVDNFVFKFDNKEYNLGVSIGIVAIDKSFNSYEDALKLADTSCYLAKEAGRNQIHMHTDADQAATLRLQQNNIISQINDALKTNRFICYVQKICSIDDNEQTIGNTQDSYEVLVRMLDEDDNIIPPNIFLPPAERYKLIYKIDHWVIKNAIQSMATIQDQFEWVSINLSGQTIAHEDSFEIIKSSIKKSNIAPNKICFEITETAAITNPEFGIEFLNKIQQLGCVVALDDFGTGLSSYEYLKRLPADILKIDGQFIKNILDETLDLAMVKSINEISHIMGKKTIGEFVENQATLEKMKEIGIDYAQGFYLDTPKPLQTLLNAQQKKVAF